VDLGLSELTGDQLLELVEQTCEELIARDPYLRNMAQATITTAADRLAVRRAALKEAVTRECGAYIQQMRDEALAEVRQAVQDGSLRLLTLEQETRAVVDSVLRAKIQVIDDTVAAIRRGAARRPDPAPERIPSDDADLSYLADDYASWERAREAQLRGKRQ
jgi:hypothetical protein